MPKILSMRITDLAEAVAPGCRMELIGIHPGEKVHEVLVAEDEARHTLEFDDKYIIRPMFQWWGRDSWKDGKPLSEGFQFASETNSQWLSPAARKSLIGESFHA